MKGVKKDQNITFTIKNMGMQGNLFKNGLKPVYRMLSNQKWRRVPWDISYKNEKTHFSLTWTHEFSDLKDENDTIFFAYTYPYSYTETLTKTKKIMQRLIKSEQAYIHREVLCHSYEGREMEMITLSSFKGITDQREPTIDEPGCLPFKELRPFMF
jgi:hypothetical protein